MSAKTGQVQIGAHDVWPSEAEQFTPRLAKSQDPALLDRIGGIHPALEERENGIGPFTAGLVCEQVTTGNRVLPASQFPLTNQVRLGRISTCASGQRSVTVAWIAKRVSGEQVDALDWPNGSAPAGRRAPKRFPGTSTPASANRPTRSMHRTSIRSGRSRRSPDCLRRSHRECD